MLRNESLAVGVNVDVAVRLFIVPFMWGLRTPATADELCESDLTSNTTCQCLMVTIPQPFQSPAYKKKMLPVHESKSKVLLQYADRGKVFVVVLGCILRN